eukprot:CAMPEP_0118950824 /NCGR_PEP_ID=MMETSP1169-20130426/52069_1 /TAXON_ID=36882 /ORGANISM="Pyramimonas obovata, Strain CCMP722" /LENGTH=322 /DNA_ID=CAMNT_0006897745 /DNA_START=51 /DNA_END=1015 /DNA_ORIENTATION=-
MGDDVPAKPVGVRWLYYLRCFSKSGLPSQAGRNAARRTYCQKRCELLRKPVEERCGAVEDVVVNNPLSTDPGNTWNQYWEVQELHKTIMLDVDRLFVAEMEIEKIQGALCRVLAVWALENPEISYKQGMHELLGMLFLVLHRDSKCSSSEGGEWEAQTGEEMEVDPSASLSDCRYLEHDAYELFDALMRGPGKGMITHYSTEKGGASAPDRVLTLLEIVDPQLHQHLQDLDVSASVFLLRWLRLLFGREFHFEDVIMLWDTLFCLTAKLRRPDGLSEVVEAFAAAMILFVRPTLIEMHDSHKCLRRLLKFPPVEDLTVLIKT